MTRYSELYRKEQAEKEKIAAELKGLIEKLVDEAALMRTFILENNLQGQLAEWALDRSRRSGSAVGGAKL